MTKYCPRCQKIVNVRPFVADIFIAKLTSFYCEECSQFIETNMEHNKNLDISGDKNAKKE